DYDALKLRAEIDLISGALGRALDNADRLIALDPRRKVGHEIKRLATDRIRKLNARLAGPPTAPGIPPAIGPQGGADHPADAVLDHRLEDVPPVALAADDRLGEAEDLLGRDVAGHRRFVRVHIALDQCRPGLPERLADDLLGVLRTLQREPGDADRLGVL